MMGAPAGGVGGLTQGNDLEVIQTEVTYPQSLLESLCFLAADR